jgi:hypothetical protein
LNTCATLAAVLCLTLAAPACDRNRGRPGGEDAGVVAAPPRAERVDPTRFLVIYQGELEALLRRHPDDCDATLGDVLRFIGENRAAFLGAVDPMVEARDPDRLVRSWMEVADRCPAQVARINQTLRALGP